MASPPKQKQTIIVGSSYIKKELKNPNFSS